MRLVSLNNSNFISSFSTRFPIMPKSFFFIDECGDPEFYGKKKKLLVDQPGFQPLLILGMVKCLNRKTLYAKVMAHKEQILADVLYSSIHSVSQADWFFHARADHPEIRASFFNFIRNLEPEVLSFHAIIGRKDLQIFNKKHNNKSAEFYFDLVSHLFQDHIESKDEHVLYLAAKPKTTLHQFTDSINKAVAHRSKAIENEKIEFRCNIVPSKEMPELSLVDYFLWALQRYLLKDEIRFWQSIEHLVGSVIDLYGVDSPVYDNSNLLRKEKLRPPLE